MWNDKRTYKQWPLSMNLGGQFIWISLVECFDHVRCIHKVFRWFPTHCIWGVVKSFQFDEVEQPWSLVIVIHPTVKYLIDLPFIGVIQLDWWQWIYGSVGDLTRASGFQQWHMEDGMDAQQSQGQTKSECMQWHFLHYWKGPKEAMVELLWRVSGSNVPWV